MTNKQKTKIQFMFVDPNMKEDVEIMLKQIIVEKILSKHTEFMRLCAIHK